MISFNFKKILLILGLLFSCVLHAEDDLSLHFQNISVRSLLQILADYGGQRIILNDSISGEMSLSLEHVNWNEAMEIVLKTHHLGRRILGNILIIAPENEILAWEKEILENEKILQDLEPMVVKNVIVQYADAEELSKIIRNPDNLLLSERGSINADKRTHSLWIQDTPYRMKAIAAMIKNWDVPVRQVIIEARIVILNRNYEKDLGVRFGLSKENHFSGTLEGANALAADTPPSSISVDQRLNVDLPAVSTSGTPSSIGLALAKLAPGILLDLELSALESEGEGKIISSPRLLTSDQESASIESGEEIPYQESTSSGATAVSFKKAVLSLKVTPKITPNHKVMMDLTVNQDTPSGITVNGVPEILTKEIKTHVLVDDGQTLVLGGIYRQDKIHSIKRVPFLGNLPWIGSLFRQKTDKINHEELLIFITPKIVENSIE